MTLQHYVQELGEQLTASDAAALGAQVAAGLLHVQASGVEHADVKLSNLMVDPAFEPPRVVLVDFGCAVLRGPGPADMDAYMQVHATASTNLTLGNPAHLAPEVQAALQRMRQLARDSTARVVVPLAHQSAFALGVLLFELAMGLDHPLGHDYPVEGTATQEAFTAVDFGALQVVAGEAFAAIVRGLLAFDPAKRMSLGLAQRQLALIAAAGGEEDHRHKHPLQPWQASAPSSFKCPITADVMQDPVICPEGHSFERRAIESWLEKVQTNPVTRTQLTKGLLVPNRALRESIESYLGGGGRGGGGGGGGV